MPLLAIIVAGVVALATMIGIRQPDIARAATQKPIAKGAIFHPTFTSEFQGVVSATKEDSTQTVRADIVTPSVWR